MGYKSLILVLFLGMAIVSCRQISLKERNIEKAISNLSERFSQLSKETSKYSNYYRLIRSVQNGKKEFEIQLRSAPDSIDDPQQIIVFINSLGECHAIPFFSNSYRDYWNFPFEPQIPSIEKTNATFEKELILGLDELHLNDTHGTGYLVIEEMLYSLLHCVRVEDSDSSKLFVLRMTNNHKIPEENSESCFVRLKQNYQRLSSEWHPSKSNSNYNSYWDDENARVYQINYNNDVWHEKLKLSIKVYRQDCVYHSFNM